jgi:hypothetical protein
MVPPRPRPRPVGVAALAAWRERGALGGPRGRRRVEVVVHRPAGRVGHGRLARPGRAGIGWLRPQRRWRRARRPVEGRVHRIVRPSAIALRPLPGSARRAARAPPLGVDVRTGRTIRPPRGSGGCRRPLPRDLRPTDRSLGWSHDLLRREPRWPFGGGGAALGSVTRGRRRIWRGRPTRSRRRGWRGRLLCRSSFAFVTAYRLGTEPTLRWGRRRSLHARIAGGGRRRLVAAGMAGGRRLPAGSAFLFATDRRRLRGYLRRLLAPDGCHTWPNRYGLSRSGVAPGPPIRVIAGPPARVTTGPRTGGTRRSRIRDLLLGLARRSLGAWAAAAPPLVRRVGRVLSVRSGLDGRGRRRLGAGRGGDRLGGGSLALGRGGTRGAVPVPFGGVLSIGARRREPGPRLSGVRCRRGCRGAGFLRTGVRCAGPRRCVRSGWFSRFWPVWFETPWPGGGIGRLVHASSLVRPPGRALGPAYRGGDASATGWPRPATRRTASRR